MTWEQIQHEGDRPLPCAAQKAFRCRPDAMSDDEKTILSAIVLQKGEAEAAEIFRESPEQLRDYTILKGVNSYANMLDNLIPQHDAHTTAAWIAFAEELADGVENGFEREAASLVAAFQEISERFDPKVVNTIYQTIHVPDNTLLSNEIIPAAEAAEQGASVQEISDMAADGLFGGGPMPTLKM